MLCISSSKEILKKKVVCTKITIRIQLSRRTSILLATPLALVCNEMHSLQYKQILPLDETKFNQRSSVRMYLSRSFISIIKPLGFVCNKWTLFSNKQISPLDVTKFYKRSTVRMYLSRSFISMVKP